MGKGPVGNGMVNGKCPLKIPRDGIIFIGPITIVENGQGWGVICLDDLVVFRDALVAGP